MIGIDIKIKYKKTTEQEYNRTWVFENSSLQENQMTHHFYENHVSLQCIHNGGFQFWCIVYICSQYYRNAFDISIP